MRIIRIAVYVFVIWQTIIDRSERIKRVSSSCDLCLLPIRFGRCWQGRCRHGNRSSQQNSNRTYHPFSNPPYVFAHSDLPPIMTETPITDGGPSHPHGIVLNAYLSNVIACPRHPSPPALPAYASLLQPLPKRCYSEYLPSPCSKGSSRMLHQAASCPCQRYD